MGIELAPDENVFFPSPYVPSEPNLVVITNQRIVQFGDEGRQELRTRDITFVGRLSERPRVLVGVALLVIALPLLVTGAWMALTASPQAAPAVAPAAAPSAAVDDDPAGPAPSGPSIFSRLGGALDVVSGRIAGVAVAVLGLAFLVGAGLSIAAKRHLVLLRAGDTLLRVRAASPVEQTQILATVQATRDAARAASPTGSAAAPVEKAAPEGDPVAALQQLGAARAAGKIGDEEFRARRAALLDQLRKR